MNIQMEVKQEMHSKPMGYGRTASAFPSELKQWGTWGWVGFSNTV